jgi:hypothetical protein
MEMTLQKFIDLMIIILLSLLLKPMRLDYDSMDALKKATDKPLIIINESMQFSCWSKLNLYNAVCR